MDMWSLCVEWREVWGCECLVEWTWGGREMGSCADGGGGMNGR